MHQTFGAGPFLVSDNIQLAWAELRGIAGNFVHTSAYGQWGDVMMELVQQDSEGPSPFRDMFEPGQQGIHHVAVMVDSMKDAYEHFASQRVRRCSKSRDNLWRRVRFYRYCRKIRSYD